MKLYELFVTSDLFRLWWIFWEKYDISSRSHVCKREAKTQWQPCKSRIQWRDCTDSRRRVLSVICLCIISWWRGLPTSDVYSNVVMHISAALQCFIIRLFCQIFYFHEIITASCDLYIALSNRAWETFTWLRMSRPEHVIIVSMWREGWLGYIPCLTTGQSVWRWRGKHS